MGKTIRYDNGFNHGRDDKPPGAQCAPTSDHPKGFNTRDDDHGYYGAGGARFMKKAASAARRIYFKRDLAKIMKETVDSF